MRARTVEIRMNDGSFPEFPEELQFVRTDVPQQALFMRAFYRGQMRLNFFISREDAAVLRDFINEALSSGEGRPHA